MGSFGNWDQPTEYTDYQARGIPVPTDINPREGAAREVLVRLHRMTGLTLPLALIVSRYP